MKMIQKVLVLTGMHRSGTSLIAAYLTSCNLYMGKNLLYKEVKPKVKESFLGHHEDLEFLEFHMEALRSRRKNTSGLFVKNANSFAQSIARIPVELNEVEHARAKQLIETRAHLNQWSWKDPRSTLFLQFWHSLIDNPRYLFIFRNPLSVVDSLVRRGKDKIIAKDPLNGLKIWIVYNSEILKFQKTYPDICLIYEIDDIISHSNVFLKALQERFDLNLNDVEFKDFFQGNAFHSSPSDQVQLLKENHPRMVDKAMYIYLELKSIASELNH